MKEFVGIPTEALEAARENRELRCLAEATDKRIEAACKSAEAVRAAQEARAKKLARLRKKQMQGLRRCLGYAVVGAAAFGAARLNLLDPWLSLGIVGGLLVALGFNLAEAVRLDKEARRG